MSDNFTLPHILTVKSSAGAGKTYHLALRYIQLLIQKPYAKKKMYHLAPHTVAITFTNKAASEMRSRIIDWMKRIILDLPFEHSTSKALETIRAPLVLLNKNKSRVEKIKFVPLTSGEVIKIINANFDDLLAHFNDFKVSTIDSFVNLILKASAYKLDIPPDFDITLDSSSYLDLVLEEILQKILEDDNIKKRFDVFLDNYIQIEAEAKWVPKIFLKELMSKFWEEESKENKEFTSRTNLDRIKTVKDQLVNKINTLLDYFHKTDNIKPHQNFIKALQKLAFSDLFYFKDSKYYQKLSLQECLSKNSSLPDKKTDILWQKIRNDLRVYIESLAGTRFSTYLDIFNLFKDYLRKEVKQRQRIVLIEELNKLLQSIIHDRSFIPEIYYALSEKYSHFLIDEFQDTNHLQWKNIQILAEEALSKGGTLFLVGDPKQAIYRWRGGKPELVDEITQETVYPLYELHLDTNFRSDEYIVQFNKIIFKKENLEGLGRLVSSSQQENILSSYEHSAQNFLSGKKDAGYVCIKRLIEKEGAGVPDTFLKEEKNEIIKKNFADLLKKIIERRVFQSKDIAVLVRKREEARFIVKTLLEMGLSVESEFTVNIKNNPLIKEMINLFRFLHRSDDDLSLAGFLVGQIFARSCGMEKDTIYHWIEQNRLNDRKTFLYKLFQKDHPGIWETLFESIFKQTGYLPLYELYILILKQWDILVNFPQENLYFLHLGELIKDQESSLGDFLEFWDQKSDLYAEGEKESSFRLKTTEGANAIKVLTIHKSKGLEFPVVILPFLKLNRYSSSDHRNKARYVTGGRDQLQLVYITKDFIPYSPSLERIIQEKEKEYLIDEINNIYVACTRAQKELYILLADSPDPYRNYLIDYFFNLEELKKNNNTIEMGKPHEKKIQKESRFPDDQIKFNDWGKDIKWINRIFPRIEKSEAMALKQARAKRKGEVIHYILSLIKQRERSDQDLDEKIETGLAKFNYFHEKEDIRKILFTFFKNPEVHQFFVLDKGDVVYSEREIIDKEGKAHKADRIIVRKDRIDLVDFKTGEPRMEEHREQIGRYAELLKMIYKNKTIKKYLLYRDEVIEV
ncbi:MAG: UvrD-helicase domain-containing protein [Spirochaetes bacterium]|nr:UvrD-helicase domain-containing protein [Spirochaetota bacterium]